MTKYVGKWQSTMHIMPLFYGLNVCVGVCVCVHVHVHVHVD